MPASTAMNHDGWIELKPGVPWPPELNRLARQQGLCLAIATVYDETAGPFASAPRRSRNATGLSGPTGDRPGRTGSVPRDQGLGPGRFNYFASKGERLRFQDQVFSDAVALRFLETKLDLDQISYSLIRISDGDLAFELHQRLLEGEASFEDLASQYSEGPEKTSSGRIGPVSLNQAHTAVVDKLRSSAAGQLWPPFFLEDIWLILRLDRWWSPAQRHRPGAIAQQLLDGGGGRAQQLLDGEPQAHCCRTPWRLRRSPTNPAASTASNWILLAGK